MDTADLVTRLRADAQSSMLETIRYADIWMRRHGSLKNKMDEASFRIAKRDDQLLKDSMSSYIWHRDHSAWCNQMLQMLEREGMRVQR